MQYINDYSWEFQPQSTVLVNKNLKDYNKKNAPI